MCSHSRKQTHTWTKTNANICQKLKPITLRRCCNSAHLKLYSEAERCRCFSYILIMEIRGFFFCLFVRLKRPVFCWTHSQQQNHTELQVSPQLSKHEKQNPIYINERLHPRNSFSKFIKLNKATKSEGRASTVGRVDILEAHGETPLRADLQSRPGREADSLNLCRKKTQRGTGGALTATVWLPGS